jgi:hypothetical protein
VRGSLAERGAAFSHRRDSRDGRGRRRLPAVTAGSRAP